MKQIKIPFKDGNMVAYAPKESQEHDWKDNHEFKATLHIKGVVRGNSSAKFELFDEGEFWTNARYEMFLIDMLEMLQKTKIEKGIVTGVFCFVKRGRNYGIQWVG